MWDTRYRPMRFSDVLGQTGAVEVLKARLAKGTAFDTSYIFSGGHGQGKCVRGDTLVPTDRGLVPISMLMGPTNISPLDVEVRQETGTSRSAYSYRGGIRRTLKIRTYLGFELEGTPNHRVRVMSVDGRIEWRRLDALYLGDYACIVRKGVWGRGPDLSGYSYLRNQHDKSSIPFTPPETLNEDWGHLMGYMVGDGFCGARNSVTISCAEEDVKLKIYDLLETLGGSASLTVDKRRKSLVSVRCFRKQLRSFLAFLGVGYVGAENKTIPWTVLASPEPIVCAFLRAYFESDGSVGGGAVEAVTKSPQLAQQLQVALASLGIITRRFTKQHVKYGTYWRIRVMGTSVPTFQEKVGFVSSRKKQALADFVARKHAKGRRTLPNTCDVVPYQEEHVARFYAFLPEESRTRETSHFFRCRRGEASCTTRQVAAIALDFPNLPEADHFRHLHAAGYVYDPVEDISSGECEVFDLNVPEGESFSANGFMNHNTTLARILSRAMLCQNRTADQEPCNECEACKDVLNEESAAISERDAASQGTIDHAREIVKSLNFVVEGAAKRIFIFDEAHRMSRDAQDVFLKPIEDKRMVGIFCTTEPDKIRGPIRSRCEDYQIRRITREDVLARMKWVLGQESVEYEDDAVLTAIDHAGGHVRDVLNQLEMIAQLGPITLQAVREHLNLSLVSTYYEILLALGTPATSVRLADEACERAGSDEVAEGLAEAAMSSYRLAHGMFAEFTYVDRELAAKVHATYGDSVLKFSEYFLRSYRVSKTALLSDIIACSSGVPAQTSAAPTIIQVAAPVAQAPAAQITAAPPLSYVTSAPPVTPTAPPPAPKAETKSNGIGNKGSGDVCALTSIDDRGIADNPRVERMPKISVPQGDRAEFLTPEEFRMKLLIRFAAMGTGGA